MIDRKEYFGFSDVFMRVEPVEALMRKIGSADHGPEFEDRIRASLEKLLSDSRDISRVVEAEVRTAKKACPGPDSAYSFRNLSSSGG